MISYRTNTRSIIRIAVDILPIGPTTLKIVLSPDVNLDLIAILALLDRSRIPFSIGKVSGLDDENGTNDIHYQNTKWGNIEA